MLTQPKLLTVVIANDDLARLYTTINSLQAMRYRNHEIVCVIPSHYTTILQSIKRDFNWMPIITGRYSTLGTLLEEARERARYAYTDAILFIEAGAVVDVQFLNKMAQDLRHYTNVDIFMPMIVSPGGKTIIGASKFGKWPHELAPHFEDEPMTSDKETNHFLGGCVLVRTNVSVKYTLPHAQETALFYWVSQMIEQGIQARFLNDVSMFFDGMLMTDLSHHTVIPARIYESLERYIEKYGNSYDKMRFQLRYRWRKEGGIVARILENVWQAKVAREENF